MPDASLQRHWMPDVQPYVVGQERDRHLDALYTLGECVIFALMWRSQDHENGLVGRCPTCYLPERKTAEAFGQAKRERCPDCFGTTFEGGFRAIIERPSIWDVEPVEQHAAPRGDTFQASARVQTTDDFALNTDDYVFRRDGTRWQIRKTDWDLLRTGFGYPIQRETLLGWNLTSVDLEDRSSTAYMLPPTPEQLTNILTHQIGDHLGGCGDFELLHGPLNPRLMRRRIVVDAAPAIDSASRSGTFGRRPHDDAPAIDSATRRAIESRSALDAVHALDSTSRSGVYGRHPFDAAPAIDGGARHIVRVRSALEVAQAIDSATRHITRVRTASDSAPAVASAAGVNLSHPVVPGSAWRSVSAFHQGGTSFVRTRYFADGRTYLYLGAMDPTWSLAVVDVTNVDAMAVLGMEFSPNWGGFGTGLLAAALWFPDATPRDVMLMSPSLGGGGNPGGQGVAAFDLGTEASPDATPDAGGTQTVGYGSISGGSALYVEQKNGRFYWSALYGFVDADFLFYGEISGNSLINTGTYSGWTGSTQFSTPHHYLATLIPHPDPASNKVYSFGSDWTMIIDGWPPTITSLSGAPLVTAYSLPRRMMPLRAASTPTLVAMTQHITVGGSNDQHGGTVHYVTLADPLNPVYSRWDFATDTTGGIQLLLIGNEGAGVETMMYDDRHCFAVTKNLTTNAYKLWQLDLLTQTVMGSWTIPSWPETFGALTGCFVTKNYKMLGIVSTANVWGLPLW